MVSYYQDIPNGFIIRTSLMVSYYQDKQQQNTLHIQHMSLNKALFKNPYEN